jgi:hypothetical protein
MNFHTLLNAGLFQVTWFAAVMGGTLAGAGACALLAAHALARGRARADLTLAAVLGAIGFGLDTLWIQTGVLDYHGSLLAPPWIVALWVAVGFSINHSLSMFLGRPWLAALAVAAACPFSYLGGAALGGVTIAEPWRLAIVALAWSALFANVFGRIAPFVNRQFEPDR